jgi:hypothetical protein
MRIPLRVLFPGAFPGQTQPHFTPSTRMQLLSTLEDAPLGQCVAPFLSVPASGCCHSPSTCVLYLLT